MATAFKQVANNAQSTAASGSLNNTTNPVTFSVGSGHGARFPQPGNGFWVTVWDASAYPNPFSDPNMEVMLCTARSTDSLTCTRGQRGTSAVAHTGTPDVRLLIDSTHISDLQTAVNAVEATAAVKVSGANTSTSISANSTYTETIAVGAGKTACHVWLSGTTTTLSAIVTTTASETTTICQSNGSAAGAHGANTDLGYGFGTGADRLDVRLWNAVYDSSTGNLSLTFKNFDGSNSRTLNASWVVIAV